MFDMENKRIGIVEANKHTYKESSFIDLAGFWISIIVIVIVVLVFGYKAL